MTTEQITRPSPVLVPVRLDPDAVVPAFMRAVGHLDRAATKELDAAGIDAGLRELLRLRVSQVNGCAYCVDMHSSAAREVGETERRVHAVAVWRETQFFTEAERAAFALVEEMAAMADRHVPQVAYDEATADLGEQEIAAIVALVVAVSAWNAIGVTLRPWPTGPDD